MQGLPERVGAEIGKIVEGEGFELVHLELKPWSGGHLLRIDIDKEGGITLEDCALVSQQVSALLDVEDPIKGHYELQVSSPGLDRKFYRESDYQKFQGRLVRVKTAKAVGGLHVIVGRLSKYDGSGIEVVDPKSEKQYAIPMDIIKETRLEVEI